MDDMDEMQEWNVIIDGNIYKIKADKFEIIGDSIVFQEKLAADIYSEVAAVPSALSIVTKINDENTKIR